MMLNGSLPVKRWVVLYRPLWALYRWRAHRNYLKSNPSLLVNIPPHEITSTRSQGKDALGLVPCWTLHRVGRKLIFYYDEILFWMNIPSSLKNRCSYPSKGTLRAVTARHFIR